MMDKMTLEHVARDFRAYAADGGASLSQGDLLLIADAIDAEIKSRGEPIYEVRLFDGPNRWREVEKTEYEQFDEHVRRVLYTAPPAPKIEVTDAMVKRAIRAFRVKHTMGLEGDENLFRAALEAALKETP